MKKTPIALVSALVIILVACSDFFPEKIVERTGPGGAGGAPPPLPEKVVQDQRACEYEEVEATDTRRAFVWNLATKSVCPKVREFRYYVTLLRQSVQQLCIEKEHAGVERDLEHHWLGAMTSFEYLVANPMEPLRADMNRLAKEIYSWPEFNKFALNAEYLKAAELDDQYVMSLTPSRKGMGAIERLIYNKEALLTPNQTGVLRPEEVAFNELPREKRLRARCLVLRQMADDVAVHAEQLYTEWAADQNQYPRRMLERFSSEQPMILNEISDGLFYLEKVKDFKLGLPLGQNARCLEEHCADQVEHLLSGASVAALRANYDAFRAGLVGTHGPGFLTLVNQVGKAELAQTMTAIIDGMDADLKEVEASGTLYDQVLAVDRSQCSNVNSPYAVCRLFFRYKEFSALYRSDFMTALNLNPPRTEADND